MNKADCTNLNLEVREGYDAIKSLWRALGPWKKLFGSVAPVSRGEHVTAVMQHSHMIMQIADDIDSAAMACRSAAETLGECDPVIQYKKWLQAMPRTRSLSRDGYDAFHRSVSAVREHRESEPKDTKHQHDLYRSLQIASGIASQLAGRAIDYQAHSVDAIAWSTIYQAGHVKKIEINCREGAVSGGRALGISSTQAIRELLDAPGKASPSEIALDSDHEQAACTRPEAIREDDSARVKKTKARALVAYQSYEMKESEGLTHREIAQKLRDCHRELLVQIKDEGFISDDSYPSKSTIKSFIDEETARRALLRDVRKN